MVERDNPMWAIPTKDSSGTKLFKVLSRVKYHCFEDGVSLCSKYKEPDSSEYEIESGEILSRPDIACAICRQRWARYYGVGM